MTPYLSLTQINPDLPVVWQDPTTLRVGFDRAVASLEAAAPATQTVVARLIRGASETELALSGPAAVEHAVGELGPVLVRRSVPAGTVTARETLGTQDVPAAVLQAAPRNPASAALHRAADALGWQAGRGTRTASPGGGAPTEVLPPADVPPADVPPADVPAADGVSPATGLPPGDGCPPTDDVSLRPAPSTRVFDDGVDVPGLREALARSSACVLRRDKKPPDLAIQVLRFLEPLGRTARWLSAGVPQLVVRFSDAAARVGPLVSADGSPCHGCEVLHLTDADPALPAIAAQLTDVRPGSETGEVSQIVAAAALQFVHAWRRGEAWVHTRQLELPVARGTICAFPRLRRIRTHPDCGCAISGPPRPPPQTVTAGVRHEPRSRSPTATARRARG